MSKKYNMVEFAFAKDVVRDFPELKKELERATKVCYKYSHFAAAHHALQALNESLELIDQQLSYYSVVFQKKGQE